MRLGKYATYSGASSMHLLGFSAPSAKKLLEDRTEAI